MLVEQHLVPVHVPLVFLLKQSLEFTFVVPEFMLDARVVDVADDVFVVFDRNHFQVAEYVQVFIEA